MSKLMREKSSFVREHYDAIAKDYQRIVREDFKLRFGETVRRVLSQYQLFSGSFLDLGCGPGNLKDEIQELSTGFTYSGVDISPEMLKLAERNGYQTHESDLLSFLRDQRDSCYDHIVCLGVLSLVPFSEARMTIDGINRVARVSWMVSLEQYSEEHLRTTRASSGLVLHNNSKMRFDYPLSEDFHEIRRYRPRENKPPEAISSRYLFRHFHG